MTYVATTAASLIGWLIYGYDLNPYFVLVSFHFKKKEEDRFSVIYSYWHSH